MTGAELAAISGVSAATVSHAMTGRRVAYTTIRKLARGLTVTPALAGIDAIILGKPHADGKGNAAVAGPTAALVEAERVSAQLPA